MEENEKINLFISYAHEDSDHLKDLLKYLEGKELSEIIDVWYDERITPGSEWNDKIIENLNKSDIVILMLSVDFLNSGYINKIELSKSYERRAKNECEVIPLFIRKCSLAVYEDIRKLNGLPRNQNWLLSMGEKIDEGFFEIQEGIKNKAIEILSKKKERNSRSVRLKEPVAKLQVNSTSDSLISQDIMQNSELVESNDNIYAVLIANYTFSKLKGKDIPSVKTNLKELENTFKVDLNFKNVFPIDNKDCSDIRKELERIIKKCPIESTLVLYYSGHGLIDSNSFYLASEDTELDHDDNNKLLKSSAVSAQSVKELLGECKAKHKVLIFDCCYSSAFLNNSLSVDDNMYVKQNFEIKDTYYLFSSVETKVALYPVNEPDRPTYFTEALLKALKTGVAPNYEYCSLEQIFELTKDELEKIKDPSGIPVPHAIKPDSGPLEEIRICSNPKYVRRSAEKELSTDFESLTHDEIKLWVNGSSRNDPGIEKALKTLITRHKDDIEMITRDTYDNKNNDIQILETMIFLLKKALERKNDLETFNTAFRKYANKFSEFSNSQNQENNAPENKGASQSESASRSNNILLEPENLKAETENKKPVFEIKNNQNDNGRNQAQFTIK
jgi:hypothetical protein